MQRVLIAALAALIATPAAGLAQRDRDRDRDRPAQQTDADAFRWEGRIPEGR